MFENLRYFLYIIIQSNFSVMKNTAFETLNYAKYSVSNSKLHITFLTQTNSNTDIF